MEKYQPGIGITAGSLMLKWDMLQGILSKDDKIGEFKKVNVCINFESIMRNMSLQKNINVLSSYHKQDVVIEMESAILNLIANYRSFFRRFGCETNVFLYYTDLSSDEEQTMSIYNKFYRAYYKNHYTKNPEAKVVGGLVDEIIYPETKLILEYVPGCYFIRSKRFDSSLVPAIVDKLKPADLNIIITSDQFDTLYFFKERFKPILVKRRYANFKVMSTVEEMVQSIVPSESIFDLQPFLVSPMYYRLLLTINGNPNRNIAGVRGIGYGKLLSMIHDGIDSGSLLKDFKTIESVINVFPEKYRNDVMDSFKCMDLDVQLELLTKGDYDYIESQFIDRSDLTSLEALNNRRFLNNQINISGLLQ